MAKRKAKVAIIDNSIDSSIYNPVDHWRTYLGVESHSFKAAKSRFPDLGAGYTHIILTGSEASILNREKWVFEEVEVIQDAMDRELSILGSCYGHQLLVLALLGPAHVRRCAHPEIGWIPVKVKVENGLLGEKKIGHSFSIHFDEVMNLTDSFVVLASSRYCQVQAFQMKERPVWGLQIHPEIDIRRGQELLKKLISLKLEATPLFEKALRSKPEDSGLIRKIIKEFLRPWK